MTNAEAIKIAQGLITDFKCESETMVEFCNIVIKALSVEPQGDLISREAILNKIAEIDKLSETGKTDEALALMKECFESLTPKQTEWISVKDRLPEEHKAEEIAEERYLVTYTYENCKGNHICIGIDFYRDGEWQNHSEDVYEHVTAWMPSPSPYKGE